mmetsp:Transcript_22569/g.31426  ORF Transcript_22569/g.31426 Transcript_22569/m.31426 type:complete len:206 (+) Transcript_22569:134-751(+)|eukprot:CAMPEP_0196587342 /NCGR_PEP_ID=MMETSP1081-20130531/57185_1 /TAXON_ID=36882 /ORGANISM="Pyramimonas amylifera, Strain CCMP720" /LENGTH=205 /DNA_ID=CAMNT_0041909507 /DNA_START=128 /DNA_END=745 /DNA_ORIENTATION=-
MAHLKTLIPAKVTVNSRGISGRSVSGSLKAGCGRVAPGRFRPLQTFALKDGIVVDAKPVNEKGEIDIEVSISGGNTQSKFNQVLKDLSRNSPPIPGYRKAKGGKNAAVPTSMLLNMLGKQRVYGFVIDDLVSNILLDYATEEGLDTEKEASLEKDNKQLQEGFAPGKPLEFSAKLQLKGYENSEEGSGENSEEDSDDVTKAKADA